MRKASGFIFLLAFTFRLAAQTDCSDDAIMAMRGTWKQHTDNGLPAVRDTDTRNRCLAGIAELFKASFSELKGMEAAYYASGAKPLFTDAPAGFQFNSLYMPWYCNTHLHKMMVSTETGTWAYVYVNSFGWFFGQHDGVGLSLNGVPMYQLPAKKSVWKGYDLYQPTGENPSASSCVVLTQGSRLPWKAVSQKQYLQTLRTGLAGIVAKMPSDYYNRKIQAIDKYLRYNSSATLQSPALLLHNEIGDFKGNFSTEAKGARMLVTVDTGYFNPQVAASTPQLMVLYWRWDQHTPAQFFKQQLEAHFPVEKLKAMLDPKTPVVSTAPTTIYSTKAAIEPTRQTPRTGPASLDDYIFTPPPGWTPKHYPDGIVLFAPGGNTDERCNITILPMRLASANITADINKAFHDVFNVFGIVNGSTRNSIIRGISAQGWEYYILKNGIRVPNGNYQAQFGFLFVAKLGARLALISGISKDPLVSGCFGLNLTDVWPRFFYSLRFKDWNSPIPEQKMMGRLAGVWMSVTATAGDRWVLAPNGRYASAAAAERYTQLSNSEVLAVTDAYFGNGSCSLQGPSITFISDNEKGTPERGWYRREQESFDQGRSWEDKLYILRTSRVDGKEYEVPYKLQR